MATPPNSPDRVVASGASPTPSLGSSFPTMVASDAGYIADSSSAEFQFYHSKSDQQLPSEESEVVQPVRVVSDGDGVAPMDYSPVTSPESTDGEGEDSTCSFESPPSVLKESSPLKSSLSRKGDRVWKWVKHICPSKRKAHDGSEGYESGTAAPLCFPFGLPLNRRSCSSASVQKRSPYVGPSPGVVVHPDGPPMDK